MPADATAAIQFFVIQIIFQLIAMVICLWLSDLFKEE